MPSFFVNLQKRNAYLARTIMKRLYLVLLGAMLCFPAFAQYDFTTELSQRMVVSTASPKFHNYYISLQCAPKPSAEGEFVYFIYSQTSSHKDDDRFRFHLGTSVESALETIGHLQAMLTEPVGTSEMMPNYNSQSEVRVSASKRLGNILRIQNQGQTGFVYLTRQTLEIMEDALSHWDVHTGSAFDKKSLTDWGAIQTEISLYENRLNAGKRKSPTDYSPSYKKLFKQRIREYRNDLKQ